MKSGTRLATNGLFLGTLREVIAVSTTLPLPRRAG